MRAGQARIRAHIKEITHYVRTGQTRADFLIALKQMKTPVRS